MLRAISSRLRDVAPPLRSLKHPLDPLSSSILSFHSIAAVKSPFSQSLPLQKSEGRHPDEVNREPTAPPRLLVVQPRLRPDNVLHSKLAEALNLANSLEEQRDGFFDTQLSEKQLPHHVVVQNPAARLTHADTYFGKGTVETVKCHLNAIDGEEGVDAVFVNAKLTGVQQRNLESLWGKPVLDRVSLIIEIFNAHAFTKEAKLQAELAALMYRRSRLVRVRGADGRHTFGSSGEAEVVSARGRKSGGSGGKGGFVGGAGETELQLQRQRIIKTRKQLLSEIGEVRRTRALQRASRKRRGGDEQGGMATVAVVGYTNAGKSTLVSVLSNSELYSDDRLFATVDPKVRSVRLPSGRTVLASDTVGFISDLPIQLVEAFHATLEEVVEADLLVHVLDSSASNLEEQRRAVMEVLEQIGVPEHKLENMIEVYNKIDIQRKDTTEDDDDYSDNSGESADSSLTTDVIEEETRDDQEHADSDRWFAADDEIDTWVDEDGSSVGIGDSLEDQKSFSYNKTWTMRKNKEPESFVKTSAITGVGLQELLELVDSKLKIEDPNKKIGKDIFHRKWRAPSQEEDSSVAC
ncbi:GTP-binding protein At3g49725, chloroplastic [Impatiens glandulifera]|uniref:GTP-binding protein At3g49725, chloroplastic n=1 Tax=Impatiens glandulifera TaxID=253017 RepID=UPI001FB0C541|nr:GTP-binding protein At3g49725, chloroplastic [Impatiens glandulifera]